MNSRYMASLEQALAEIDAELNRLTGKRKAVAELIASENEPARQQKVSPIYPRGIRWIAPRGSPFTPDPNSKASKRLDAAARYVTDSGRDELPFLEVYQHLPHELNGSRQAREDFRSALQASGKRVGLTYEKRPDGPVIRRLKPSA